MSIMCVGGKSLRIMKYLSYNSGDLDQWKELSELLDEQEIRDSVIQNINIVNEFKTIQFGFKGKLQDKTRFQHLINQKNKFEPSILKSHIINERDRIKFKKKVRQILDAKFENYDEVSI